MWGLIKPQQNVLRKFANCLRELLAFNSTLLNDHLIGLIVCVDVDVLLMRELLDFCYMHVRSASKKIVILIYTRKL